MNSDCWGRMFKASSGPLDFGASYRHDVERFWRGSGQHFKVLARLSLLGHACTSERAGRNPTPPTLP